MSGRKYEASRPSPEQLERFEPIPEAAADRERCVEAHTVDQAGHGHAIKLPVEGDASALGEGCAAVQVSEPLCGCGRHADHEPDKRDGYRDRRAGADHRTVSSVSGSSRTYLTLKSKSKI
jgi:hypothetical protein